MIRTRNLLTVGGTAFCALAIGYFMQRDAPSQYASIIRHPSGLQQRVLAPFARADIDEYAMLEVRDIKLTSALPGLPVPTRLAQPTLEHVTDGAVAARELSLPVPPGDPMHPELGCNVTVASSVLPLARVALSVEASCFPNQRVTVHHSGLFFTDTTDGKGALDVTIPALSEQAVFIIEFENGAGAVARAEVDELLEFERVAIQWGGESGLQINAKSDNGVTPVTANDSAYGDVVRLGKLGNSTSRVAEIYSVPRDQLARSDAISLTIEAEVTAANCDRDIAAQSLELRANRSLRMRDLTLSMPSCDATGDFLVLNNLVEDLKIAGK
ncbi:hypothetical protein [Ruegeria hyattellae]|uniref:hypothetical protein n=1 Tax=Ruegeria hyattellae TaxID=3233337 RepID=UPI00355BC4F4